MSGVCRDIGRERRSRASLVEITLGRERRSRASLVENRLSARLSEGESQRSALSAQRLAGFTKHLFVVGAHALSSAQLLSGVSRVRTNQSSSHTARSTTTSW